MEILNVIVAAVAAWVFGAVWYMALAKRWMAASGLTEDKINRANPVPYVVSFVNAVLVAGMMRHVLASAGLSSLGGGLMVGAGLGLFIALPWQINNVLYGMRDKALIWIDGGYIVFGCVIIGVVLTLF